MTLWVVNIQVVRGNEESVAELLEERELDRWHLYWEPDNPPAWARGVFPGKEEAEKEAAGLMSGFPGGLLEGKPAFSPLEDRDWRHAYREHFHPWHFAGLHWVPAWQREGYVPPPGEEVVWLDPGMAFGTGNHETTRLCVERMVFVLREWKSSGRDPGHGEAVDAGCGSGILALSAARLGFGRVRGFDTDPAAVAASRANARLNGLGEKVGFTEADLRAGLLERPADLVLANIQADVLCRHASHLARAVKPGGSLVLSGILGEELSGVEAVFRREWPTARMDSRIMGEWGDLWMRD